MQFNFLTGKFFDVDMQHPLFVFLFYSIFLFVFRCSTFLYYLYTKYLQFQKIMQQVKV